MIVPSSIKVSSEYLCYPLWLNNYEEDYNYYAETEEEKFTLPNIDPNWLPISQVLKDKIEYWDSFYQNLFINTSKVFETRDMTKDEEEWFHKEGQEIYNLLQKELPNVNIEYQEG